jgi:hypothetical protein
VINVGGPKVTVVKDERVTAKQFSNSETELEMGVLDPLRCLLEDVRGQEQVTYCLKVGVGGWLHRCSSDNHYRMRDLSHT